MLSLSIQLFAVSSLNEMVSFITSFRFGIYTIQRWMYAEYGTLETSLCCGFVSNLVWWICMWSSKLCYVMNSQIGSGNEWNRFFGWRCVLRITVIHDGDLLQRDSLIFIRCALCGSFNWWRFFWQIFNHIDYKGGFYGSSPFNWINT